MKRLIISLFSTLLIGMLANNGVNAETGNAAFFEQAEMVLSEDLDNQRGQGGVDILTLNRQNVTALLKDNTATNNINGFNIIDNGSFAGASGMISVIQNSGNNVIIQDSTVFNVTVIP